MTYQTFIISQNTRTGSISLSLILILKSKQTIHILLSLFVFLGCGFNNFWQLMQNCIETHLLEICCYVPFVFFKYDSFPLVFI